MFVNNQGQFFQRLNNDQRKTLNSVEAQTFWRGIWSERKEHQKDVK